MDLSTLLSMLLRGQQAPMQAGAGGPGTPPPGIPGPPGAGPLGQPPGMGGGSWQDILISMLQPPSAGGQPFGDDMIARQIPGSRQPPSRNQIANKPGLSGRPAPMRPGGRTPPVRDAMARQPQVDRSGQQMYKDWSQATGNRQGISYEDFQKPSQAGWYKDQWRNRNAG